MSHIAAGETLKYEWGTQLQKFKSTLPTDKEWEQFKPSEKPKYKNKILSYITAIDNKLIDKVIIVRIKSQPVVDYLFVNDKLYTIMENWGKVLLRHPLWCDIRSDAQELHGLILRNGQGSPNNVS